jgi:hypothetical protein
MLREEVQRRGKNRHPQPTLIEARQQRRSPVAVAAPDHMLAFFPRSQVLPGAHTPIVWRWLMFKWGLPMVRAPVF